MPTDEDPQAGVTFLLLAPYRGHWEIVSYPSARVLKANCGHLVWLSPQGEGHVQTCYTACCDCAEELIRDPNSTGMAVPGALDYIRAHASDAEMREVRAVMREFGIQE
jgi:hypothetical protein